MFHVYEYSVFYPCCKYAIREGSSLSLLQGGLGAHMEETVRRVTDTSHLASPADCDRRRGKLKIFLNPRAYIEGENVYYFELTR